MLLKRNILETLTLCACCGSIICIALNCFTNISLITGLYLPIYVLIVFIISTAISFKCIQWLLHLNKPIKYDVCVILRSYPYFKFLLPKSYFIKKVKSFEEEPEQEYDTNDLSVISAVLERRLVSSWYVPYISEEIGFPFACKHMLDQMIEKAFEICNKIDIKDIYVDVTSIMVSHLKEYQKAMKRQEKAAGPIENHYKKSYGLNNANQSMEHCTNILRLVLKDLTPWELWDTPQSELLVRILSKRLDNYIDNTISDPLWLNDKLHTLLCDKVRDSLDEYEVPASDEQLQESNPKPNEPNLETESALNTLITKSMVPILHTALDTSFVDDEPENNDFNFTETNFSYENNLNGNNTDLAEKDSELAGNNPLDISSPKLREKRGRQGRNEVKIYDRIIEGSVKTWDTDVDLACISVGQDLLATLDGEITLSRLWDSDNREPQPLWFGEDDIDLEFTASDLSPKKEGSPKKDGSPTKKDGSPKPTEALLKDIQSTVSHAKTKIGDLQVDDTHTRDEAAGMMEGLLDFGIAGLRKGLRFTGLHDNQDKSPSHTKDKDRFSPDSLRGKVLSEKDFEIHREDHPTVPPLVKQTRVSSQDSMVRGKPESVPALPESPEPEYEESADLSTSIAKLRSLLHQPGPTRHETWSGAAETRGRTQAHPCSRPVDTAAFADEYDMSADRLSPITVEHTNNMQRLDKLFARTVTGVLNSIKTAVGAEGEGDVSSGPRYVHWTYACTALHMSLGCSISRLVASREAGAVDAALDSLHHINPPPTKPIVLDTLDYDEWCSVLGARATGVLEVSSCLGLVKSHVALRLATILVADVAERVISAWLKELTLWMKKEVFEVFKQMSKQEYSYTPPKPKEFREFKMDDTCALIMAKLPMPFYVFGEETISQSVKLVVSSLTHRQVNKDITYRLVDLAALHFKKSATVRNPSFHVN